MFKKAIIVESEYESDEEKKPQDYNQKIDVQVSLYFDLFQEDFSFNFNRNNQDNDGSQKAIQSYCVSALNEIQEMEFTNQDYVQDVSIDGSKFEKSSNNFKYDFVLSEYGSNYQPQVDDCFDILASQKMNLTLSKQERDRRRLGEICCIAIKKQIIAVGFSSSCVIVWQNIQAIEPSNEKQIMIPSELGSLLCMDFHWDGQMLVGGSTTGQIIFIDIQRGMIVQNFSNIHKVNILTVRLIHRVKEEVLVTISCDANGIGQVVNFEKGLFSYKVVQQPLTKQTKQPCNSVQVLHPDIQSTFFESIGQQELPNTVRRIVAVMNTEKLWIISVKITREKIPEMNVLLEFDCPTNNFSMSQLDSLSTCCSFGEGFLRNQKGKYLQSQMILMCCWGTKLFHVDLQDKLNFQGLNYNEEESQQPIAQEQFQISSFIDFRSRILSCNFLESSICIVITETKGVFLVNTISLRKDDQTDLDLKAINFNDKIVYKGQSLKLNVNVKMSTKKKFRRAVIQILRNRQIELNLKPKNYLYNVKQEDHETINYVQSFASCISVECQTLALIHEQGVSIARIADWQKSMGSFYRAGEWAEGMHYVVSIYRGTSRYVTRFLQYSLDDRRKLIQDRIYDIANKYFKMIMDCITESKSKMDEAQRSFQNDQDQDMDIDEHQQYVLDQINSYKTLYAVLIEFLILTDSNEMLFQVIMPKTAIILNDGNTFFLQCLEPFYAFRKLSYIPEDVLVVIIEYYKKKRHMDLIQKLVFSLDHSQIDTGYLIQVCLKVGLLKSLVVICEKGDTEEFLTPVVQIWCYVLIFMQKGEFEKAQYFLLRALSYIQMALQKKLITGQPLQLEKFDDVVRAISKWIFSDDNLYKLLTIEPASTFEVLQMFFTPEISVIINKINIFNGSDYIEDWIMDENKTNKGRIMVLIQNMVQKLTSEVNSQIVADPADLQSTDSQKQRYFTSQKQDVTLIFVLFQVRAFMSKNLKITNGRIILCLKYILKNLRALDQLYLSELVGYLTIKEKLEYQKWEDQNEVISYLKSEYLVRIIRAVVKNDIIQRDLEDLKELVHLADLTSLSSTCIQLAFQKQEYKRAFDFHIYSKNSLVKSKIFSWIWSTMELLESQQFIMASRQQYEMLQVYILQKLTDLIKINSESTRDVVARFNKDAESQVIHKLDAYPALQLEYVENVLKKERQAGHLVNNEMLLLNASLLGNLAPHKLLKELQSNEYPLEDILPLCRQFKINEATAYVLERLGSITEAVAIHVEMFRELCRKLSKEAQQKFDQQPKLNSSKSMASKSFRDIVKSNTYEIFKEGASLQFQQAIKFIISVCELNNNDIKDQIWYDLLDSIIEIKDTIFMKQQSQKFLWNLCTESVCNIIATIAKSRNLNNLQSSNLSNLLEQLQSKYDNLDMGQLKLTFQEIISNYIYVQNVLSNSHGLIRADLAIKIERLLKNYQKGVVSRGICCECHIDVTKDGEYACEQEGVVIFRCGHSYHRGCVVEQWNIFLCQLCCQRDETYAYNLLFINNKISLDKLTENLKVRNQFLLDKDELKNEDDEEKKLEALLNIENMTFKQNVSKNCEANRKKRTDKMKQFDRKKFNYINLVEQQTSGQAQLLKMK